MNSQDTTVVEQFEPKIQKKQNRVRSAFYTTFLPLLAQLILRFLNSFSALITILTFYGIIFEVGDRFYNMSCLWSRIYLFVATVITLVMKGVFNDFNHKLASKSTSLVLQDLFKFKLWVNHQPTRTNEFSQSTGHCETKKHSTLVNVQKSCSFNFTCQAEYFFQFKKTSIVKDRTSMF